MTKKKDTEDIINSEKEDVVSPVPFFSLFRYSRISEKVLIVIAVIFGAVSSFCTVAKLIIYGNMVDTLIVFDKTLNNMTSQHTPILTKDEFLHKSRNLCALHLAFGIMFFVCNYVMTSLLSITADNQTLKIRCLFMSSMLRQDIGWYDTTETGDFISRITGDLSRIRQGIGEKFGICICSLLTSILCAAYGIYYGWKLALVTLALSPIFILSIAVIFKIEGSVSRLKTEEYAKAATVAEEVLSSIRTVFAFGGEKMEMNRYNTYLMPTCRSAIKRGVLSAAARGGYWFTVFGVYVVAFWYGVRLIVAEHDHAHPDYTAGKLITIFYCIINASEMIGSTSPFFEIFARARSSATKCFSVIERTPPIDSSSEQGDRPNCIVGNIKIRDVHFKYPSRPSTPILRGVSIDIRSGETVALVGSSGCGKSTIIQLILRFYETNAGEVSVDGRNVRDLNVGWLRDKIGLVGQEPVLFSTSIAENIRYGKTSASMEDIENAAKLSNAHDFIKSLPQQYETQVGERGVQLSGGQKQRIAIARALVKNPKILLLDEATSALDTESEAMVQTALDQARRGRTTVVVAHRLSTIRKADKIVVLSGGRVEEVGTHHQLMNKRGIYYQLIHAQATSQNSEDILKIGGMPKISDFRNKPPAVTDCAGRRHSSVESEVFLSKVPTVKAHPKEIGEKFNFGRQMSENSDDKRRASRNSCAVANTTFSDFPVSESRPRNSKDRNSNLQYASSIRRMSMVNAYFQPRSSISSLYRQMAINDADSRNFDMTSASQGVDVLLKNFPDDAEVEYHKGRKLSFGFGKLFKRLSSDSTNNKQVANCLVRQMSIINNDKVTLTMSYEKPTRQKETPTAPLRRLWRISSPEWPFTLVGVICSLVVGMFYSAIGILVGLFLGVLSHNDTKVITSRTEFYCEIFLGIAVITGVLNFTQIFMLTITAEKCIFRIRKMIFAKLLAQDVDFFDDAKNSVGSLCSKLSSDVEDVQVVTGYTMTVLLEAGSVLVTSLVLAVWFNWKIGLVVMSFIPMLLLAMIFENCIILRHVKSEKQSLMTASKVAVEAIGNIRTVASLHLEKTLYDQFHSALSVSHKKSRLRSHLRGLVYGFSQAINGLVYAASLYYGSILVSRQELTFDSLIKIIEGIISGIDMIGMAVAFTPDFYRAKIGAARIVQFLDLKSNINEFLIRGKKMESVQGHISFDDVHFKYASRPEQPVLRGLNLSVQPGQTVALVGSSGCGKSSCLHLIQRFYDTLHGSVRLDGEDVKDINVANLRSVVGIVSQEPVLFSYSIAENIAYGDNSRTVQMQEIIEAARQANIHDFIASLPQGYDTPVGDRGTQLSGGQKQRVAIARALLRNPKILLLDEATSALDAESEKVVQDALDKARNGRTCIIVAHRLTTTQNSDAILVIRNGKITEKGTHQELLANKGHYFKLYSTQGAVE